jgi:RNA polymerase sigma factor (sigma-70 family)
MTSGTTLKVESCITTCAERAWRLACALVWNTEDAHDAVQQACLVAASKPRQIPADDPWPWFARVVTLECLKLREKRAKAARLVNALKGEAMAENAADTAESRELQSRVKTALTQLPLEQRDALMLTHLGGLSMREAAESLGVSSSTVDRRVKQGLEDLRKRVGGKESALSAALVALPFDQPAQGMQGSIESWLGMVHSQVAGASAGGIPMLKYVVIALVAIGLIGCAFCLLHVNANPDDMRELHDTLWRFFHG